MAYSPEWDSRFVAFGFDNGSVSTPPWFFAEGRTLILLTSWIAFGASRTKPPGRTSAAIQNKVVRIVGIEGIIPALLKLGGDRDHLTWKLVSPSFC